MHNREPRRSGDRHHGRHRRRSSRARSTIAERAGIARERIVLDPGIGFGKTPEQSLIAIARLGELKSFGLPLLVGASRKRFIDKVSPAPPDRRLGGSIAAHLAAVDGRRRDRPHPRRRRDRAGAARRRRHPERPMTDTVFVTGLALHAYHGVMQHEAKVGQTFKLDLVLDIDLAAGLALRQARAHRGLRPGGRRGEPRVLRPALPAGGGRRRRGRRCRARALPPGHGRAGDGAQAACADRRDLRGCRRDHRAHAASDVMAEALLALGGNVGDVRADARSRGRACSATAATCACSRAPPTTARRPGASPTSRRSSICASRSTTSLTPHALLARAQAVERALGRDRSRRAPLGSAHRRHRSPRL